jgi:ATP-binding cassette subfamily B protein
VTALTAERTDDVAAGVSAREHVIHPDTSRSWLRRALPLIRRRGWQFAGALGAALGSLLLTFEFPRVLNAAVNEALVAKSTPLLPYVREALVLALASGILAFLARQQLMRLAYDLEADLRELVFDHISAMSSDFYDRYRSGELISRASSDVRAIQLYLAFGPFVVVQCAGALVAFGFMVTIDWVLALVSLGVLPLVAWSAVRLQRTLLPASWIIQSRLAEVATVVDESVSGVRVVKSFGAERRQLAALARTAARLAWAMVRDADLRSRWAPVAQNAAQLGMVLVLVIGSQRVLSGDLQVGAILAFATYAFLVQAPFQMVGALVMLGQRASASAQRVFELLDEAPRVADSPQASQLVITDGEVVFQGVRFGYSPERPVLAGVDLRLRRGEVVALVGRAGSGKTTLTRLLTRDYDVDAGRITIDGQDIRSVTLSSLRRSVAQALEEPFLFSGTIRDNIRYGRPRASDREVEEAARLASAHDFIAALPEGYDTIVGERGYTLSGGQRQRVALAREALMGAPVLILDDATSALDVEVESAVHAALTADPRGRTTLVVAHRLSTIAAADRVVVLDEGRVIAEGSHHELLRTSPVYADVLAHAHPHEAPRDEAEARTELSEPVGEVLPL